MQTFLTKNRWMALVASALCQCICNFPGVWGVLQPYVATEYDYSLDSSTLVMPLCVVAFGFLSILGGRLQDVTGSPRVSAIIGGTMVGVAFINAYWIPAGNPLFMYIGFSFFFGGGCGFLFSAFFTCAMKWYTDKKGFANGVSGSFASFYLIPLSLVLRNLLTILGTRKTFLVMGIFSVLVIAICALFFVNPTEEYMQEKNALQNNTKKNAKPQPDVVDFKTNEMLRTKQYYLLILSIILVTPAFMLINPALVTISMEKGLTEAAALALFSASTIAAALGRLIIPWLSDYLGRKKTMVASWAVVVVTAFLFMVGTSKTIPVVFTVMAFFNSGGFVIVAPMSTELFGYKYSGTNVGFVNIATSVGSLSGPLLLSVFAPLLGTNARGIIGVTGALISVLLLLAINTNMQVAKEKLTAKT